MVIYMKKMKNGHNRYIAGHIGEKILNTPENRFFLKVLPKNENGCMLWIGAIKKNGYGFFSVNRKNIHVHRYSYEYHNKIKIPVGECVLHKCDIRNCVSPEHLFLGSQKDNIKDMIDKKRDYWSKHKILSNDEKKELYLKIKNGCNVKNLVKDYSISKSTCYRIFYLMEKENGKNTS